MSRHSAVTIGKKRMGQLLHVSNITKDFPGTRALDGVELAIDVGEVHGLLGENGAGKSTLVKILSGNLLPDAGNITFLGSAVTIGSPAQAQQLGIAVVHQELSLVPELSIAENIFVGRLPRNRLGLVDRQRLKEATRNLLARMHLALDPDTAVAELSLAHRQMIEIAKALSLNCRLLILDEPTSALTEKETQVLLALIATLKRQGVSILYISHKLSEVFRITDRITILRDGALVGTYPTSTVDETAVVRMMVGRTLAGYYPPKQPQVSGEEVLRVDNLVTDLIGPCSFSLRRGEILGISGLVGAGRSELARALFGVDRWHRGTIVLHGQRMRLCNPAQAVRAGIGMLPEDRKSAGLFLELAIHSNVAAASLTRVSRAGLIRRDLEHQLAEHYMRTLRIRATGPSQPVRTLSGGNQQKVLLAKWLAIHPKLLIVDEPTRGIDVGAKSEIHSLLRELASGGVGIIMISSELPEILGMSDRILVMYAGRIVAEIDATDATEETLLTYASGQTPIASMTA